MNADFFQNPERLLLLFPLLPVLGIIIIAFSKYVLNKEITAVIVPVFTLLQAAAGILLVIAGPDLYTVVEVSPLEASVRFAFSKERVWFLGAFIVPAVFAAGKARGFGSGSLRTVFLFYLAAGSGILVTSDIFNFFVFYELMIMSAYVLIAVQGKVYASIKYMFVGAFSAVFFLTGIIFVYASGLPFSFSAVADLSQIPAVNARLIMTFFFTAFCIKSAMFPASSWLPTCHSAGNGTVSAFLSSFTVVSGFFGMYYLVLLPAEAAGYHEFFSLLKILALITMGMSALFIFFDTDIKRTVAGSTIFIAGLIGYSFATENPETAWTYIIVHAIYKTILFHATDDLDKQPLRLRGRTITFITMGTVLFFAGGIFPSVPHFLKRGMDIHGWGTTAVLYGSTALLLGGFIKFTVTGDKVGPRPASVYIYILAAAVLIAEYLFLLFPGYARSLKGLQPVNSLFSGTFIDYLPEISAVCGAVILGKVIFPRIGSLANLDSRYIFRNLNIEMFALLLLFSAVAVYINVLPLLH